ncbi:hypothetical protein NSTCB13_04020 [Nostoc sp. DSM 114160]|jgi:hypothetical protein
MKNVFEPSCLFISEVKWKDEIKRDEFLEHLLDNLSNINHHEITKVYWTDKLEELLWDYPQLPPWRQDKDWSNSIIPVIYNLFRNTQEFLQNTKNLPACLVQPDLTNDSFKEIIMNSFLELMHILIDKNENVYMCLGVDKIKQEYTFLCNCHSCVLNPIMIKKSVDWLESIDLTTTYWPTSVDDIDKISKALDVIFEKNNIKPIYEYEFSKIFLKDLINVRNHKKDILYSIAKRLTLTKQQAAKDGALQDEHIKQKKEYRFRVTQRPYSTRIHYESIAKKIRFLKYYDEGEHDNGL